MTAHAMRVGCTTTDANCIINDRFICARIEDYKPADPDVINLP